MHARPAAAPEAPLTSAEASYSPALCRPPLALHIRLCLSPYLQLSFHYYYYYFLLEVLPIGRRVHEWEITENYRKCIKQRFNSFWSAALIFSGSSRHFYPTLLLYFGQLPWIQWIRSYTSLLKIFSGDLSEPRHFFKFEIWTSTDRLPVALLLGQGALCMAWSSNQCCITYIAFSLLKSSIIQNKVSLVLPRPPLNTILHSKLKC